MNRENLTDSKRIVIKVGSSLLEETSPDVIGDLVKQISSLKRMGRDPVLVSSGAIFFGMKTLDRKDYPVTLPQKQATAAVGQSKLMHFYEKFFRKNDLVSAQVLLTQKGINNRETYLNASNTLNQLLSMGTIPIVNENDTEATEEIQFGDNDTLSALVTTLIDADLLIILTDVDGLYRGKPTPEKTPIHEIEAVTDDVWKLAEPSDSGRATVGGMKTKLKAAEKITQAGTPMIIASGFEDDVLEKILSGKRTGTYFEPASEHEAIQGRKRWIGYHLPCKGSIRVDSGADRALSNRGKSLLPSGIIETSGQFDRGDVVKILNDSENELGRGLSNYTHDEVDQLKGCHTDEISDILGYHDFDEIIHRDNLVIFPNDSKND